VVKKMKFNKIIIRFGDYTSIQKFTEKKKVL